MVEKERLLNDDLAGRTAFSRREGGRRTRGWLSSCRRWAWLLSSEPGMRERTKVMLRDFRLGLGENVAIGRGQSLRDEEKVERIVG